MEEAAKFRETAKNVKAPLRHLFSLLSRTYSLIPLNQPPEGQYWLVSCMEYPDSESENSLLPAALAVQGCREFRLPLFYMQSGTGLLRPAEDVTGFFRENDILFKHLIAADKRLLLEPVQSVLGSAFIAIYAKFCGPNRVPEPILNEDVCLITAECLDCMQMERGGCARAHRRGRSTTVSPLISSLYSGMPFAFVGLRNVI